MTIKQSFYKTLEENDLTLMASVPKSDMHNHAGRGGNIKDLSPDIKPPKEYFDSLDDMQDWFQNNVKPYCGIGVDGYLYRVEAAFRQASMDGIHKLSLSFGNGEVDALGGMEQFTKVMDTYRAKYIPDGEFIPELSLLRDNISSEETDKLKELISYGWFKALDVCGDELRAPVDSYSSLYEYAGKQGLRLRLHVGEFGTGDDVKKAVEVLKLDELHHGIAAVQCKDTMKYLADHKIILNICPTSNIMLKRVSGYKEHPIRELYHAGVPVTINTDDLAIFNATVSQEYMYLYNHGVFSKEELNEIRLGGLTSYNKYN